MTSSLEKDEEKSAFKATNLYHDPDDSNESHCPVLITEPSTYNIVKINELEQFHANPDPHGLDPASKNNKYNNNKPPKTRWLLLICCVILSATNVPSQFGPIINFTANVYNVKSQTISTVLMHSFIASMICGFLFSVFLLEKFQCKVVVITACLAVIGNILRYLSIQASSIFTFINSKQPNLLLFRLGSCLTTSTSNIFTITAAATIAQGWFPELEHNICVTFLSISSILGNLLAVFLAPNIVYLNENNNLQINNLTYEYSKNQELTGKLTIFFSILTSVSIICTSILTILCRHEKGLPISMPNMIRKDAYRMKAAYSQIFKTYNFWLITPIIALAFTGESLF